jgi:hypothetical protein
MNSGPIALSTTRQLSLVSNSPTKPLARPTNGDTDDDVRQTPAKALLSQEPLLIDKAA